MPARVFLNCFLIFIFTFVYSEESVIPKQFRYKKVHSYEENEILSMAGHENLPIVAFFLGEKQSPWSQRLIQDVLQNASFVDAVVEDALLWEITSDEALRQKYRVVEYPQILMLDPKGREFARMGYLPLSGPEYADRITGLIKSFEEICIATATNEDVFQEEVWIDLYSKAKQLSIPCFAKMLLERGMKKEKGMFFHLEKFAALLEKRKLKDPEVLHVKKDLLKRDPKNQLGVHFKVAVLEFQKLRSRRRANEHFEKALQPLFEYVNRFKSKGDQNFWRAEMMIAEFLFSKKQIPLALQYAKAACDAAPEGVKSQILETISFLNGEG